MLNLILAFIFSAAVPLVFKYLLHSDISVYLIISIVWIKTAANLLSQKSSGRINRIFRVICPLITLFIALMILIGILITPFSAYSIWFESVKDQIHRGVVSNLFVLLFIFFSSTLNPFLNYTLLPAAALVIAGLLSLIYQTSPFFIALIVSLAGLVLYLALRYTPRGKKLKSIIAYTLFSLVIAGTALLFSHFVDARGSRIVDQKIHPELRKAIVTLFPRFPLLYSIPGYGFSFNTKWLGGTPVLSGSPIFEVSGGKPGPLYLRTRVYSFYNGSAWRVNESHSAGEGIRLNQLFLKDTSSISGKALKLKLLQEYYHILPHTLDTMSVILGSTINEPLSGDFNSSFIFSKPLRFGDTFYLERGILRYPAILEDRQIYLQIPEKLPQQLKEIAANLGFGIKDPEIVLHSIESFLAENSTYNLKTSSVGHSEDFVTNFIFEQREGYCVHFASTFVILARLNNIPARYVTGFLHYHSENKKSSTITGLSAHAWPEVWIEGKGWTTWEATPVLNPLYYSEFGDEWFYEYDLQQNRITNRQLQALLGFKHIGRRPAVEPGEQNLPLSMLLYIILILMFLVLLFFIYRFIFSASLFLKNDRAKALHILKRIVTSQALKNLPAPETTGWVLWAGKVKKALPNAVFKVECLLTLILKISYSSTFVSRRDVRFLNGIYYRFCRKSV